MLDPQWLYLVLFMGGSKSPIIAFGVGFAFAKIRCVSHKKRSSGWGTSSDSTTCVGQKIDN